MSRSNLSRRKFMRMSGAFISASALSGRFDAPSAAGATRLTEVSIDGEQFLINGRPTYEGRLWNNHRIEGLLLNSRMVQATFDDLNPETRDYWKYPDSGKWDPDRNTEEFIKAMPEWKAHGLLAFTVNLQGGSPRQGKEQQQIWHNSGITETGELRKEYMDRLERIMEAADRLGMVVILGIFYWGQDHRLRDEKSAIRGVDNTVDWILDHDYRHVLIEVNNECNVYYDHEILKAHRVHELIVRIKERGRNGRRLLVSTSFSGGVIPGEDVVRAADFILLHGNGVKDPERIKEMVRISREIPGAQSKPVIFNEDDHFDFEKPNNNFVAATSEYSSWGYFDPGTNDYKDGYQTPPVNWAITTERKKAFFSKVREISGN